jgi:hypothetical protein
MAAHEDLNRSHVVKPSSDTSFGLVFFGFFALIGLIPLWRHGTVRFWALGVSAAFLATSFVCPRVLRPLNFIWMRFGALLNKVTNPIVMGVLFYGVVTPVALVMRLCGKHPLPLKFDPDADTYWIERHPPGPDPKTMIHQF